MTTTTVLQLVFAQGGGGPSISVTTLFQIMGALLVGAIIPIILYFATHRNQKTEKLKDKADITQKQLRVVEQEKLEEKLEFWLAAVEDLAKAIKELADKSLVNELKQEVSSLRNGLGSLQRDFDRRLSDCQRTFVTTESFKHDMDAQKAYLKFVIGFMRKQTENLSQEFPGDDEV